MNDFVINSVGNVVLVTVNNVKNSAGALADIFTAIGNAHINVDMICQTAPYKDRINLSFSIDNSDLVNTLSVVGGIKKTEPALITEVNGGNTKITIFSELLKTEWGVAARLFNVLSQNGLHTKLITTSDVEVSILVDDSDAEKTINVLKEEFK